ncbi:MAG: hypothetical protein IKM88_04915 [Lachnospiraceae bacterium]|nr:hypothetical protein [Lachnospiraceae bacterium]MBR6849559.1 hypothetical protein [Lachnospiraceae bacterium]
MDIKDILEEIALPARSNKHGFKVTDKLEKIDEVLQREGSPFHLIKKSDHAWIFGQEEMEWGKKALLVSSHADIVKDIQHPFSELDEETHYFKGTYDNLGTNGASVDLMLNHEIPKNVYFSFTAEEESGRNTGAEFSYAYVRNRTGQAPDVIVLDVTDEGYDNDRLFTVEGLTAPAEEDRTRFLNTIYQIEGEKQSFEVVRMYKKDDNSFLPKSYRSTELTAADESYFYAKQKCLSFSMDLPTDGSMHSDSGLYTKEAVMYGYCASLAQMCYVLTNTYPEKVEALAEEKDAYVKRAEDTEFRKKKFFSYWGSSWTEEYPSIYHPIFGHSSAQERVTGSDEDYIDGQMSIADYLDPEDYGGSAGYPYSEDPDEFFESVDDGDPEFQEWYQNMEDLAYKSAIQYDKEHGLNQYLNDVITAPSVGLDFDEVPDELIDRLVSIWADAWQDAEYIHSMDDMDYD